MNNPTTKQVDLRDEKAARDYLRFYRPEFEAVPDASLQVTHKENCWALVADEVPGSRDEATHQVFIVDDFYGRVYEYGKVSIEEALARWRQDVTGNEDLRPPLPILPT